MSRTMAIAAFALCAWGCALLSRGESLSVRYFTPEPPSVRVGSPSEQPHAPRPALRLGRVRGAPYLRERIAHRESAYELGFYDDREWTERPEAYVQRALARKLFEERGFRQVTGAAGPTLDVDVLAFEEVRTPGVHGARIAVRYRLHNDEVVLDERTITVDRAVEGPRFDDVVEAMSRALDEVTDRIADRIVELTAAARTRADR